MDRWAGIVLGILMIGGIFFWGIDPIYGKEEIVIPVEVGLVCKAKINHRWRFVGRITSAKDVPVFPKVMGKFVRYEKKIGEQVKKGEVIALIDRDVTGQVYEYHKVVSPIDGVLLKADVDEGMVVTSDKPVAVVADISFYKVKLSVPEVYRGKIKEGLSCEIKAYSVDRQLDGEVIKVEAIVDPVVAEFPVEVQVKNKGILFYPGEVARVDIFSAPVESLVMPLNALLRMPGTGSDYCFVVKDGKIEKRFIKVGQIVGESVEVLSGLEEGDMVVISGQGILDTGMKVKVVRVSDICKAAGE